MTITELEAKVIAQIARAEHSPVNGAIPEEVYEASTWIDCVDCCYVPFEAIKGKQLAGVMGSLYEKSLIDSNGESVGLTDEGFKVFQEGPYSKDEGDKMTALEKSILADRQDDSENMLHYAIKLWRSNQRADRQEYADAVIKVCTGLLKQR